MADAAPAHVRDVQQAVDAAQVHERAEVGDVLDHAAAYLALRDLLHELTLHGVALLLDEATARDHDVHAALVDLDDLALDLATDEVADVGVTPDRDLRGGQEHGDADVDDESALDLAHDAPAHRVAFLVRLDDAFPAAQAIRLALADHDAAGIVVHALEEHLDDVADIDVVDVVELGLRDDTFGLEADVDDDVVVHDVEDTAFHDRVAREVTDVCRVVLTVVGEDLGDFLVQRLRGQVDALE